MGRARPAWVAVVMALSACTPTCDDGTDLPSRSARCDVPLIRDDRGGVLVLRGASVSADAKWTRARFPPVGRDELRQLRHELGMNAIRLLVFWEAIERYPGIYDDSYLDAVQAFVEAAGREGLHVIVDMHQDLYGRGFGSAGAPWWSCDTTAYRTFNKRDPWFLGYLQREVGACFDRLYREGETRAAFFGAWAELARRLEGTDAVLAYDLLNEPFWGSTRAREFEQEVLPAFYRELIDVIRLADPRPWIMVEPAPAANIGVPSELADIDRSRLMYGPHFYPPAVELGHGYHGDTSAIRQQLGVLCSDAQRLDMPLVVGEVGVRRDVPGATDYLEDAWSLFDARSVNAIYWNLERGGSSSYGLLQEDGELSGQAKAIAHPYPERIAGTPLDWSWDPVERVFVARWKEHDEASGETRVSLPRLVFPGEVKVTLERGGSHRRDDNVLHIPRTGGPRQLTVRPREQRARAATGGRGRFGGGVGPF